MTWLEPQIHTRARLDEEMTERAFAELAASISNTESVPLFFVDDLEQADGAVKTCLRYNGVEPGKVPEGVDDVDEWIDWLCRPSGTMYRKVHLDEDWYKQAFGALLGSLDTGEMVALLPSGLRGYCYIEPGSGRRVRVSAKVAPHINPEAVLFYKPLPMQKLTMRDFYAFVMRVFSRDDYLLVLYAALAATLIGFLPPWANRVAYGVVVPSGRVRLIAPIAALLVGVTVSSALINVWRNLIMARVSTKLDVTVAAAAFSRLLSLPSSFFKEYESGELAMRLSNISALSMQFVSLFLGTSLTSLLSLTYVFQIAFYAPALALPALLVVLCQAVLTVVVTRITMSYEEASLTENAKVSGIVTALLNGIRKIKLAGAEDRALAKWAHGYARYARSTYNRPPLLQALPALVALVGTFGNVLIFYLAGSTHVSYDRFMAFNVSYGQITGALMAFAAGAGELVKIRPMAEMIKPLLETEPETSDDRPSVSSLTGEIEVSGVSFRYNENAPYVVQDLSFKIRSGEYVAIVGKSGCGKSTIMRLLLGFEVPARGTILYGSHDVSKVNLRSLRQQIGTVMQDGKLFLGDIMSNITISTPSATEDDAWAAAKIADIADDIRKMPMGMRTVVTEGGGSMSGGQRQRLMIARAVCGKHKILMFDEATSALDNKTQRHVSDSLEKLNCTRLVIAHRLSTVRHCDRILVVDGGKIAEEGTYEELIAKGGLFAKLVDRQRLGEGNEGEEDQDA